MQHLSFEPCHPRSLMKRLYFGALAFFCLLLVSSPHGVRAQGFSVQYRVSRPHCILYLLESLRGEPHHSSHLKDLFLARRGANHEDEKVINEYRELYRDDSDKLNLPADGNFKRNLEYALEVVAVESLNVDEFLRHSRLLLTAKRHGALCEAVRHFEPLYEELIWKDCGPEITRQKDELIAKADEIGFEEKLSRVLRFTGSAWPVNEGFVVALVPIPKKPGEHILSYGHANGFIEVVEVPSGAKISQHLGVIAHEIFHTFWTNRPASVCDELRKWFADEGALAAYRELNEALATAVGNGWVDSLVAGKYPSGEWYNDSYIDGYGKGLFDIVRSYCMASRQIDGDFARKAAAVFIRRFPNAESDPKLFMRELIIVTDEKEVFGDNFRFSINRYVPVRSIYGGFPINDEKTRKRFAERSDLTALFMIRPQELESLSGIGLEPSLIGELREQSAGKEYLLYRRRVSSRWLIFCIAPSLEGQQKALWSLFDKKPE